MYNQILLRNLSRKTKENFQLPLKEESKQETQELKKLRNEIFGKEIKEEKVKKKGDKKSENLTLIPKTSQHHDSSGIQPIS